LIPNNIVFQGFGNQDNAFINVYLL